VLDEPNSNLDPLGEQSLNDAIHQMRQAGKIVVIVAHRPSAIFAANKILSVRGGRAEMFGPKEQVLAALFPRIGQPHKPSQMMGPQSGGGTAVTQPGPVAATGGVISELHPTPSTQSEPEVPGVGPSTRTDSPATATVTSLDATRAQR
jgi:ATP-binding cassette subfamily C protein PrsD